IPVRNHASRCSTSFCVHSSDPGASLGQTGMTLGWSVLPCVFCLSWAGAAARQAVRSEIHAIEHVGKCIFHSPNRCADSAVPFLMQGMKQGAAGLLFILSCARTRGAAAP